jgi:hypothetical protein
MCICISVLGVDTPVFAAFFLHTRRSFQNSAAQLREHRETSYPYPYHHEVNVRIACTIIYKYSHIYSPFSMLNAPCVAGRDSGGFVQSRYGSSSRQLLGHIRAERASWRAGARLLLFALECPNLYVQVRVRIYKNEKNFSHADLVHVIEPSEHRVQPLCKVQTLRCLHVPT